VRVRGTTSEFVEDDRSRGRLAWLATMSAHETRTGVVGHAVEALVGQNAELKGDALSDWQPM